MTDAIVTDSGWRRWRDDGQARWRASAPAARALAVAAGVLAIAALVVGDLALHTRPRHRQDVVFAAATPGPTTVDSAGCPVRVRCSVRTGLDPAMTAAVRRTVPGADIVSSVATRDAESGRTYRRVVVVRSARMTVIASAQCIPGGRPGRRRVLRTALGSGAPGTVAAPPRRLEIVVPGHGGCSASVEAEMSFVNPPNDAAVLALADDPAAQLTP